MSPGEMIRAIDQARDKIKDRDDLNFIDDMLIKTSNGFEVRALKPFQLIWIQDLHALVRV